MGLLKSFKDLKNMAAEAPAMVGEANQLAANAQAMADAQHRAAMAAAPPSAFTTPQGGAADIWAPIAGVSLELYTEISQSLATVAYDTSKSPELAAARGVAAAAWQEALDGWSARIRLHPAVAQRFNALYTGR